MYLRFKISSDEVVLHRMDDLMAESKDEYSSAIAPDPMNNDWKPTLVFRVK